MFIVIVQYCRHRRLRTGVGLVVGWLALAGLPASAAAAIQLRCEISQGGEVRNLEFEPATDPYSAKPVDIRGNFRFKAVVIGDDRRIDYVSLYAYYLNRGQAVLLHQAKYLAPAAGDGADPAALTGTNYLYSPKLGRELQYACALVESAP